MQATFADYGWETNQLLDYMAQSKDFYFDSISQIKMDRYSQDRVVLVGDSGYCASPLSGQGTSLAIVGAYILAGELAQSDDYRSALKRYDEIMHPFVQKNQEIGQYVSETYLLEGDIEKEVIDARNSQIIDKVHHAANAIELPDYR
ncbi:FAD-dependent monooxygenase [Candidatus Synchoanobacter obligatus]|uniref:FAD-dependent monooxygenase n=1 Tax=Candidatus Synchoanobacter obligatus TaxID=2919597 RepID=A0ABT1L3R8_9GAMM|nr:FAD-dependent monooxygenase [Candidatus Synchoanobacter obligatus]